MADVLSFAGDGFSVLNTDLGSIKRELISSASECSQRGLLQSSKWAAELCYAIDEVTCTQEFLPTNDVTQDFLQDYDVFNLAKSYFNLREYDRAAHFAEKCKSNKGYFLYMYSRYLAAEKHHLDDRGDAISSGNTSMTEKLENDHLKVLRTELQAKQKTEDLDGYCLYLYGVVLKKLDLLKEALIVFMEAVHKEPSHWGAWQQLSMLITDKETLNSLSLPNHWIRSIFLACTYLELQLNDEALALLQSLYDSGMSKSTYILSQIAVAYQNLRDVDKAVESFSQLQDLDPFRLEHMDIYSNLLYVKEMRPELAKLAHHCCDIDKYRVETCCVIGNYYSLRAQHEKAVLYFQRALKLNPHYLSAWTLMGHEYMEMKNTHAAIQAYRQAIEVNRRDYRAWYGLGQTYEILKMHAYCLYYYRQAQQLRPNDSRMFVALGECYEKLEKLQEAKKCFWKAHSIGDVEGTALIKLAKLYEILNEKDSAAAAYTEYINETERQGMFNFDEQPQAYRYLANYHLKNGQLDDAHTAAQKCTEFNATREEGKALLRQIARLRSLGDGVAMQVEDNGGSITSDRHLAVNAVADSPLSRLSPMNLTFTP
ncbi:unnamed protein product [Owenia fusiformis]|uniref:Cyclosome subunit 8 n=1 Tax=Owenia fusiformis TaxID=6347 RepID=A0A8S4PD72_OWEFU|nr:unnamed protein product [Owenia fusiformis]